MSVDRSRICFFMPMLTWTSYLFSHFVYATELLRGISEMTLAKVITFLVNRVPSTQQAYDNHFFFLLTENMLALINGVVWLCQLHTFIYYSL